MSLPTSNSQLLPSSYSNVRVLERGKFRYVRRNLCTMVVLEYVRIRSTRIYTTTKRNTEYGQNELWKRHHHTKNYVFYVTILPTAYMQTAWRVTLAEKLLYIERCSIYNTTYLLRARANLNYGPGKARAAPMRWGWFFCFLPLCIHRYLLMGKIQNYELLVFRCSTDFHSFQMDSQVQWFFPSSFSRFK